MSEQSYLSQCRILVAEDNLVNQKVIKAILDRAGICFVLVQNGQEAFHRYQTDSFDLVLMDCQMPVIDGLEATSSIRQFEIQEKRKRCPIVALTANAMSGDRDKCLKAGMDDFLPKPFKNQDLLQKISDLIVVKNQSSTN